jgi:hypothetical protein
MSKTALNVDLRDDYIFRMTDDTGMLQHSKFGIPDPGHGYTTDDNARALIMALMLYERYGKKQYLDLVYRYAAFILNAWNRKGRFKNFMGYGRNWLEEEGSEDCFGRCLWTLGFAVSNGVTPHGIKNALHQLLNEAIPYVASLNSLRAKAYTVVGLAHLDSEYAKRLVSEIAWSLCGQYDQYRDETWRWFENIITYSNNVIPWSLLRAYRNTGEARFLEVAEESLDFLSKITFKNGYFKPIGCNGWLLKGQSPAGFDEQPVEACEAVLTYLEAFAVTENEHYLQKAKKCHAWYDGVNSKSLISYLISYLKQS